MSKQKRVSIMIAALFVTANIGLAQSQPQALDILTKVATTYRTMKSFQAEATISTDMTSPGMQQKMEMPMTLAAVLPDKMRMENKRAPMNMLLVSNGQTVWMYMPQINKYAKMDASKFPGAGGGIGAPGMAGYGNIARQYADIADRVKRVRILREEALSIDGRDEACYVLEVEHETPPIPPAPPAFAKSMPTNIERSAETLWVDKARFVVVRHSFETKVTFPNSGAPMQSKITTTFSKIRLDEPVADELFAFTPPNGATEMDLSQFLPAQTGSAQAKSPKGENTKR
jgi:outer membrane lipoprotein-sorting protein